MPGATESDRNNHSRPPRDYDPSAAAAAIDPSPAFQSLGSTKSTVAAATGKRLSHLFFKDHKSRLSRATAVIMRWRPGRA
jgi:hypothetical protein